MICSLIERLQEPDQKTKKTISWEEIDRQEPDDEPPSLRSNIVKKLYISEPLIRAAGLQIRFH